MNVNFRAPEVLQGMCQKYYEADFYSLGIFLFVMMVGDFPYYEEYSEYGTKHGEQKDMMSALLK